jgi:hypothetical protein
MFLSSFIAEAGNMVHLESGKVADRREAIQITAEDRYGKSTPKRASSEEGSRGTRNTRSSSSEGSPE